MTLPSHVRARSRRHKYLVGGVVLVVFALTSGCKKPRERNQTDPHLAKAFELAETDPDRALEELKLAKNALPADRAFLRGRALEGRGDRNEAVSSYRAAIKINPQAAPAHVGLGRLLLLKGELGPARHHLTVALQQAPEALEAALLLAIAARTDKERTQARVALQAWDESRPNASKKSAPLRSEYHLILASVSAEPQVIEEHLREAQIADVGSIEATLALAELAAQLNKKPLALDLLRRLARVGTTPENYTRMASLAVRLSDFGGASEILRRVPQNVRSPQLLVTKARLQLATLHAERALTYVRAARAEAGASQPRLQDEFDCLEAQILSAGGHPKQSIQILQAVLKRSPTHREAHSLLSELEIRGGQAEVASARLQKLVADYPQDATLLLELGRAQLAAQKWERARKSFQQLAEQTDGDIAAYRGMAESLSREGKAKEKVLLWERAWKKYPQRLSFLREWASALVSEKRGEEAISVVRDSSLAEEDPVGVGLLLADVHDSLGRTSDVAGVLSALVKAEPTSARAWSALAREQGRTKDHVGMEASLRMVLQLEPRALKDKARLAMLLQEQKKFSEAAKLFETLARQTGTDVVALNNTAMLYIDELDDPERAVAFAEKAHRLAPDVVQVTDTLAWALSHSKKAEDLARAQGLFKKIDAARGSAEARYHYGALLIRLGEKKEGIALVQSALAHPGDHAWKEDALQLL